MGFHLLNLFLLLLIYLNLFTLRELLTIKFYVYNITYYINVILQFKIILIGLQVWYKLILLHSEWQHCRWGNYSPSFRYSQQVHTRLHQNRWEWAYWRNWSKNWIDDCSHKPLCGFYSFCLSIRLYAFSSISACLL